LVGFLQNTLSTIEFVEYTHWQVGRVVAPHGHDDLFQLDYFPTGQGSYPFGDDVYTIDPGSVFLASRGLRHTIIGSEKRLLENLTVKFSYPELPLDFLPVVLHPRRVIADRISILFRRVISASVISSPSEMFIASFRFAEMLTRLGMKTGLRCRIWRETAGGKRAGVYAGKS